MKRYFPVLIAVLGIIVGALSVATYNTWLQKKNFYKTQYGEWRKLNLILEQVDKNYVDTVDNEKVTDAAIVAALAELDPHSVYMPPVELDAAETDLAGNFDGIGIQFNVPNDTAIVLEVIPGGPSEKAGLLQGDRILKAISDQSFVCALAIDGKKYDSPGFGNYISDLGVRGISNITFVIGGSLGLHGDVLKRADSKISFSDMTFPHQMMRVILLEQIYRAFKINRNETYHK